MDLQNKLRILADSAKYDASCASSGSKRSAQAGALGNTASCGICHSYTPDGRCVSLLKILLTNFCMYDCVFCVNRSSSDIPRARFTPAEVAQLTIDFYKRNYIEGLFLSSGIIQSPDYTMEQLIAVARSLRQEHRFNGYIHLKAIPGCSPELLKTAATFADRLSANIELPTQGDLEKLAPEKNSGVIEDAMDTVKSEIVASKEERRKTRSAPALAPAGQSTQMVIGATPSTDAQILAKSSHLYTSYGLRRVYYSAFSPFPKADARLPIAAPPLVREHRLYEADWLMRFYGFTAGELTTAQDPNLDAQVDPKLGWALRHREFFPVDVNRATREQLLRVPGLGYRNVMRVVSIRRYHRLSLEDLRKLRVSLRRCRPFVITADHHPSVTILDSETLPAKTAAPQQLALFEAATAAVVGEI
jgi:putative DNA modification/repair radical SAM protein